MIGVFGSAAAPVLAALLAWAGAATLLHRARVVDVLGALRVPLPRAMAVAVPLLEIVIAGVLVVHPADGAAAALLLVAASHVALSLWAGTGRGCPRVGSPRLDAVSWADVGRNIGLGALGVFALFGGSAVPSPSLPAVVTVSTTVLVGVVILAAGEMSGRVSSSGSSGSSGATAPPGVVR